MFMVLSRRDGELQGIAATLKNAVTRGDPLLCDTPRQCANPYKVRKL